MCAVFTIYNISHNTGIYCLAFRSIWKLVQISINTLSNEMTHELSYKTAGSVSAYRYFTTYLIYGNMNFRFQSSVDSSRW